jgi:maleamate amidohydrolase
MAVWDDVIPKADKEVYEKAGYGERQGFGEKPAILIVDITYNFVGDKPEPILKSIERFHNSCGEWGWERIENVRRLIEAGRRKKIPIIYTRGERRKDLFDSGRWKGKIKRAGEATDIEGHLGTEIVEAIRPQPEDIVISKKKPSAFFGTPLVSYLIDLDVDSLIVGGTTTSGCVRASVIDGFSYNYIVSVVEDCTFDRGIVSHKVNLFDLDAKYGDVVTLEETLKYIDRLSENLFTKVMKK